MTRRLLLALALVALAAAGWPIVSPPSVTVARAAETPRLDELMMDLDIAPLDAIDAPPLAVTALDGGSRVTLDDVKGHAALVYFWATW